MEVSCFLGLPPNPLGRIFQNKNHPFGDPLHRKNIPSHHGDLLSLHRHQGIAPAEGQVWRAAPWSHWQMRISSPKIMGKL